MKYFFFLYLLLCFLGQAVAMSYMPIPFEKQLEESDGVIEGIYLSHEFKKTNDKIVTIYTFSVSKFVGFSSNEIYNQNNFQILIPGGTWHNESYHVEGIPHFSKDEQVVLLIKKSKRGFQLTNLGLGKYVVQTIDRKKVISSSVFANHNQLGNIDYNEYVRLVNKVFNKRFAGFSNGKNVYLQGESVLEKNTGRDPASINEKIKNSGNGTSMNIFWILLLLALLGSASRIYSKKNK